MKQKSVEKNAILNAIRTILNLIGPLVTYPYVSRILGVNHIGSINYTNSIIQYFILISGLGISTYGIREGAKRRNNQIKLNLYLSECFTINVIFTAVSYAFLIILLFTFESLEKYQILLFIQSFLIFFNTIGIEWVNTIFEDYLYITIRTIFVQIINICLTFLFVRSSQDLYQYAMLSVMTSGIISISNWIYCKKKCTIRIRKKCNCKKHLKPIMIFFANRVAVTLYVGADTTMLGIMTNDYHVGLYSVSVRIYSIIKTLLAAIYTVFIPRLSYYVGVGKYENFKQLYSRMISIMTLLILPSAVGLIVISRNIIFLLFGRLYLEASKSLIFLSLAIIFAIYGGLISSAYNIVCGLEKETLKATTLAAIVNIILNIFFISQYYEIGAAVTTMIAELIMFLFCFIKAEGMLRCIDIKEVGINLLHSILGCIVVIIVNRVVVSIIESIFFSAVVIILTSVVLYFIILCLMKNKVLLEYLISKKGKI